MVRKERLELSHQRYWYLKPARLPIPPLSRMCKCLMRNESYGVADGARTHDNQNHNLALYQLNYGHHMNVPPGAPGRTRTCNPRLRRPMLYPVELRAHCGFSKLVGVERFELPTHCSQSSCATRLRYTPTYSLISSSWRILIPKTTKFNDKMRFIVHISMNV